MILNFSPSHHKILGDEKIKANQEFAGKMSSYIKMETMIKIEFLQPQTTLYDNPKPINKKYQRTNGPVNAHLKPEIYTNKLV